MSLAIGPSYVCLQEETLSSTLRRPNGLGNGWGFFATMLIGAATFGVLPLLAWPIRMRQLFAGESARLIQATRLAVPEAMACELGLPRAAQRTKPIWLFWILPVLAAAFCIIGAAAFLTGHDPSDFADLVQATYRAGQGATLDDPLGLLRSVFGVWSALLVGGYLIHFLHVQLHYSAVRRFLTRFNTALASAGLQTIRMRSRPIVPDLVWLAGGVVLTAYGAWWAVPMTLAGSIQQRGAFWLHWQLNKDLADRVDTLSQSRFRGQSRCQTLRCHERLHPRARFCPRCGTAVHTLFAAGSTWA